MSPGSMSDHDLLLAIYGEQSKHVERFDNVGLRLSRLEERMALVERSVSRASTPPGGKHAAVGALAGGGAVGALYVAIQLVQMLWGG